jgi:hypothetical protein
MTNIDFQIPSTEPNWHETIQVRFDKNVFGLVPLDISSSPTFKPVTIFLSYHFEPFQDMKDWLEKVATCHLPASWLVQDEGPEKKNHLIWTSSLPDDQLDFRITIGSDPTEASQCVLKLVVKRKQLVKQFVKAFRIFVKENYRPEHWNMLSDLREIDLSDVMLKLKQR